MTLLEIRKNSFMQLITYLSCNDYKSHLNTIHGFLKNLFCSASCFPVLFVSSLSSCSARLVLMVERVDVLFLVLYLFLQVHS